MSIGIHSRIVDQNIKFTTCQLVYLFLARCDTLFFCDVKRKRNYPQLTQVIHSLWTTRGGNDAKPLFMKSKAQCMANAARRAARGFSSQYAFLKGYCTETNPVINTVFLRSGADIFSLFVAIRPLVEAEIHAAAEYGSLVEYPDSTQVMQKLIATGARTERERKSESLWLTKYQDGRPIRWFKTVPVRNAGRSRLLASHIRPATSRRHERKKKNLQFNVSRIMVYYLPPVGALYIKCVLRIDLLAH